MTVEDPRVTPEDRSWILALEHHERALCPCGCGYPAEVSQDPENEGRFVMDLPIRCHARTALAMAKAQLDDDRTQWPEALMLERPALRNTPGRR